MRKVLNSTWKCNTKDIERVVIFDLDGTLVETTLANNVAYAHAVKLVCGFELMLSQNRITHENIQQLIKTDGTVMAEIVKTKERLFIEHLDMTRILPCSELLKALFYSHYTTILLTNGKRSRIESILLFHNIGQFFTRIFCKEDYEGANKYFCFFEQTRYNPNMIIVFENEITEVSSAILNGIPKENIFLTNNL